MARRTYQKGFLDWEKGRPTLRYRERDPLNPNKWVLRRYDLDIILKGARDKKAVQSAVDQKMAEVNEANNSPCGAAVPTLAEFVSGTWSQYMRSRGKELKQSTLYQQNSQTQAHIIPAFGERRLDEITPAMLTGFFADKSESLSAGYTENLYMRLKSLFDVACELDLIEKTPLRSKIHRPKNKKRERPKLSPDQIRTVLEHFPQEFKALGLLVCVPSIRIGEALALWWMDFDGLGATITIRRNLWRKQLQTPKTDESNKTFHLPPVVVEAVLTHKMSSRFTGPTDFIFCRGDGSPWGQQHLRDYVLYAALDAAGIKREKHNHGFHMFRRSGSKILYELTRDPKLVQEYMRHRNLSTTMDGYVGSSEYVREQATELVANAINFSLSVPQVTEAIQ